MTTKKTETNIAPTPAKKAPVKKAASPAAKPVAKPVAKVSRPEAAAKKPKKEPKMKESKVKVVRDSFTMPQDEYLKIAEIKEAALENGIAMKKSEVLRAGLKALIAMSPAQLKAELAGLEKIKTGRPKKH